MAYRKPKIIEISHISPPQATVPSTTLPVTFLDIIWLNLVPIKSIFFFNYQETTEHFINHFIPNLKHSLSITLQHFYPYAGNLISLPRPALPFIRYIDGQDSLVFTLAESVSLDFEDLITDFPKEIGVFNNLMPKLPQVHVSLDGIQTRPAMAIQVTIFPGFGISIGNISSHVVGDGVTFMHFMKYWISLCKSINGRQFCSKKVDLGFKEQLHISPKGRETMVSMNQESGGAMFLPELPIHSYRDLIKDPNDISTDYLNEFWKQNSVNNNGSYSYVSTLPNMVRTTFSLSLLQIQKLKTWVKDRSMINQSTFVVTLAFAWSILIKTLMEDQETKKDQETEKDKETDKGKDQETEKDEDENNQLLNFVFGVDCRNRLKYEETTIPLNHFGNCIIPCYVFVKKQELLGENSVVAASNAISAKIKEVLPNGILKKRNLEKEEEIAASKSLISIAGAPKLGFYDLDFGLGKPCKAEIVHIEKGRTISVLESRDGFNGVEIGVALDQHKIDTFDSILKREINKFDM